MTKQYHESAVVQISVVFDTRQHVDRLALLWSRTFQLFK